MTGIATARQTASACAASPSCSATTRYGGERGGAAGPPPSAGPARFGAVGEPLAAPAPPRAPAGAAAPRPTLRPWPAPGDPGRAGGRGARQPNDAVLLVRAQQKQLPCAARRDQGTRPEARKVGDMRLEDRRVEREIGMERRNRKGEHAFGDASLE